MTEPRIGSWWTMCCQRDLTRIETQEELEDVREWIAEGIVSPKDVWEDELSALKDIRSKWEGPGNRVELDEEIAMCDAMIGAIDGR